MDVNNPPAGGFEHGGWYWNPSLNEAQQYNKDSGFGAGTTINNPEQVGYGEVVSPEVQALSGPVAKPTNQNEVAPYLSSFQDNLLSSINSPSVKASNAMELKQGLAPPGGPPALLNRVDEYARLTEEQGVLGLENSLTDIKAQIDEEMANIISQRTAERGKPVPQNIMEGRISTAERAAQERVDFLGRQQSRLTDELNTKYKMIGQVMEYMGLDYNDAKDRFDKDFQNNLAIYGLVLDQEKLQTDIWYKEQAIATTNLTTYMNAITSGNLSYSSMSSDQKLIISKLEAQSGMPIGFISNLQISPQDTIMSFSGDKTQMMVLGKDGKFKVVSTGMRKAESGGSGSLSNAQINAAKQQVIKLGGSDADQQSVATDINFYNWVMAQDTTKKTTGLSGE